MIGEQLVLGFATHEEATAVAYVDEIVDSEGQLLRQPAGLLTPGAEFVTLDKPRSVSGLVRFGSSNVIDGCDLESNALQSTSFWRKFHSRVSEEA